MTLNLCSCASMPTSLVSHKDYTLRIALAILQKNGEEHSTGLVNVSGTRAV